MTNTFSFAITPEEAGERLDRLLSRGGRMSLRAARRLIGRGAVSVNGTGRTMAYRPRAGEEVRVEAGGDAARNGVDGGGVSTEGVSGGSAGSAGETPEPSFPEGGCVSAQDATCAAGPAVQLNGAARPAGMLTAFPGVRVIAEQGGFVAFFKPSGLHTVFLAGGDKPCLEAMLGALCPGRRVILVNRLDKETSGIVLGAAGDEEAARFRDLEDAGAVDKRYLALVEDEITESMTLCWPLDTANRVKTRVLPGKSLDPLRFTHVIPVKALGGATLVEARIAKGARHQIRAHLAGAGHPIVGDALYGGPRDLAAVIGASAVKTLAQAGDANPASSEEQAGGTGLRLHHWRVSWPGFCASMPPAWQEVQVLVERFVKENPCEST